MYRPTEDTARVIAAACGQAVRNIRQQRGLTQHELAELAGVSRATLIGVEAGATGVRLSTLIKILAPMGHAVTTCKPDVLPGAIAQTGPPRPYRDR